MAREERHDGATAAEGSSRRRGRRRHRFRRGKRSRRKSDDRGRGDLISALPDEILQHILSFMPTKYAIRTTVLSRRWRCVWSQAPSVDLDGYELSASEIDKTLASYAATKIRRFDLCLEVRDQDMASCVDSWIQIATSRHVEELSLSFDVPETVKYDLPDFLYINSTIVRLTLELYFFEMVPSDAVSWASLKNLSLRFCTLTDESIARVLSGCPKLEYLSLRSCDGFQCLDLSESLRLRRLEIIGMFPAPRKILAPYIHSLWLSGSMSCCRLADVSSLIEAKVEICFSREDIRSYLIDDLLDMALDMLQKLQNAEKLTFGSTFLQILSLAELLGLSFPTLKNKALTLDTVICKYILPGIARLLQNSPDLKELAALTETYLDIPDVCLDNYLYDHDLNQDECWRLKHSIFPHLLDTLELLEGKASEPKLAASFMEFLLRNAKALEKLVVRTVPYLNASEFEELLEMARASSSCHSGGSSGPSVFLKRWRSNVLFSV